MADLKWLPLGTFKVPAKPGGLWTLIAEYIPENTLLKIAANENAIWSYTTRTAQGCGPDGDLTSHIPPANCLVETAPAGCLVGKIGGSSADDGTETFACGAFIVYLVATDKAGPLYLTINDEKAGYDDNHGEIEVTVSTANKP